MQLPTKPILTLDVAKKIATAAEAEAIKNSWPVVVAIVDPAGQLIYFQKFDDTQIGSVEVGIAKARCAALFKRPSKALADVVAGGNVGMMSLPGAIPVEGGLPLFAGGQRQPPLVEAGRAGTSGRVDAQVDHTRCKCPEKVDSLALILEKPRSAERDLGSFHGQGGRSIDQPQPETRQILA